MEDDGALAQKLLDRGVSAFEGSWFIVATALEIAVGCGEDRSAKAREERS